MENYNLYAITSDFNSDDIYILAGNISEAIHKFVKETAKRIKTTDSIENSIRSIKRKDNVVYI